MNTKSHRLQKQEQEAYKTKDKEVKRNARNYKRAFNKMLVCKAEWVAARDEMSAIYKLTKQLSGKNISKSGLAKYKDGNNLLVEKELAVRHVQHFQEVLNCLKPEKSC